jgi:hypothetical protein
MEGLEKYDEMLVGKLNLYVSQLENKQRTENCKKMMNCLRVVDKFINN